MPSYDTPEQREAYVNRVCKRVAQLIADETPSGVWREETKWVEVKPSADAAMKATVLFIDGRISKDDLDTAMAAHLASWREQFSQGKRPPVAPSRATRT